MKQENTMIILFLNTDHKLIQVYWYVVTHRNGTQIKRIMCVTPTLPWHFLIWGPVCSSPYRPPLIDAT